MNDLLRIWKNDKIRKLRREYEKVQNFQDLEDDFFERLDIINAVFDIVSNLLKECDSFKEKIKILRDYQILKENSYILNI